MAHRGPDAKTVCLDAPAGAKEAAGENDGRAAPVFRTPVVFNPGQLRHMRLDEEERLRQDFRRLEIQAGNEFKNARTRILRQYEERLVAAKQQYLEEVVASREKLLVGRQQAREEYEKLLKSAQDNYEFTVDIVKEQYQAIRRETTRIVKMPEEGKEPEAALA